MTPKEKAKELVDRFKHHSYMDWNENIGFDYKEQTENAKQCALICVNEIIEEGYNNNMYQSRINYWKEVKQEINNL